MVRLFPPALLLLVMSVIMHASWPLMVVRTVVFSWDAWFATATWLNFVRRFRT
jgi:hypothetical protein